MKALALIQVASYGAALEAANLATHRSALELIEIIPFGAYTQILIQGPAPDLNTYRKSLRTADIQKSVIIDQPDPRLLKAYYHLENSPPQSYLLVLETEFAGYLLEWAQNLFSKNLKVVDFRQPRFPGSMACLVMTGANLSEIQDEMQKMESKKIKVSFVEELSGGFRKYFEIEP